MKRFLTFILLLCLITTSASGQFFMPNQKPMLGLQVNWAHPSAPNAGLWLFNEGSGNTVQDLSGRTNQGTIYGTVVWNSYSNGTCLYWPGSAGDYIEMPAKSIGANQGTVIIAGQRDGGGGGYLFAHQNGNNRLYAIGSGQIAIAVADTGFTLVDNTNMVADTPFEFALTYNNGTWVAYQDGTQRDTGAYTGSISSLASTWRIGDHPTDHNIWDIYILDVSLQSCPLQQ